MITRQINNQDPSLRRKIVLITIIMFFSLAFMCVSCGPTYVVQQTAPPPPPEPVVVVPPWAPLYENESQIHYYYFPDIGVYYDVWRQQFIYNDNGAWYFTPVLPASYDWYDLNTAYVVVINYQTVNPWMQHSVYVSNYPPYYYRNNTTIINNNTYVNGGGPGGPPRGYNENAKTVMYKNRPGNTHPMYKQPENNPNLPPNESRHNIRPENEQTGSGTNITKNKEDMQTHNVYNGNEAVNKGAVPTNNATNTNAPVNKGTVQKNNATNANVPVNKGTVQVNGTSNPVPNNATAPKNGGQSPKNAKTNKKVPPKSQKQPQPQSQTK